MKEILIKRMKEKQIEEVAKVASKCFSGLKDIKKARRWIKCNFNAFPRMQYFVAQKGKKVLGYILWVEKGGFREEAVFELEQIGVHPNYRGMGIGTRLIKESLRELKNSLKKRGSRLKLVEVTTGVSNEAQKLYKKTLGAKPECVIKDLFREDEVIMIARFNKK
ncbi:MAG: GNAT family N-acetyltransferase [Candidatus Aenigmatarchaeota archaeon]